MELDTTNDWAHTILKPKLIWVPLFPLMQNNLINYWIFFTELVNVWETRINDACMHAQLLSHVWLFWTPQSVDHQALLSMGFFWQEYWGELPFRPPGERHNPGIEPTFPVSPALQADSLNWTKEIMLVPNKFLLGRKDRIHLSNQNTEIQYNKSSGTPEAQLRDRAPLPEGKWGYFSYRKRHLRWNLKNE